MASLGAEQSSTQQRIKDVAGEPASASNRVTTSEASNHTDEELVNLLKSASIGDMIEIMVVYDVEDESFVTNQRDNALNTFVDFEKTAILAVNHFLGGDRFHMINDPN